jgi:hypothetical protein
VLVRVKRIIASILIAITNRKGDSGHPCFNSLDSLKLGEIAIFYSPDILKIQAFIYTHPSRTLSNAFSKSTINQICYSSSCLKRIIHVKNLYDQDEQYLVKLFLILSPMHFASHH